MRGPRHGHRPHRSGGGTARRGPPGHPQQPHARHRNRLPHGRRGRHGSGHHPPDRPRTRHRSTRGAPGNGVRARRRNRPGRHRRPDQVHPRRRGRHRRRRRRRRDRRVRISDGDFEKAVGYARRIGADVMSLSVGGTLSDDVCTAIEDAVRDSDMIVVAAAGQTYLANVVSVLDPDDSVIEPARFADVIAVAGCSDERATEGPRATADPTSTSPPGRRGVGPDFAGEVPRAGARGLHPGRASRPRSSRVPRRPGWPTGVVARSSRRRTRTRRWPGRSGRCC